MAIQNKVRRTPQDYAAELEEIIQKRFPRAEFEFRRISAKEYDLRIYGDFEDMEDVLELVSDRPVDILLVSGIHIHVLPLGRRTDRNS